jgi:hypothetical protein
MEYGDLPVYDGEKDSCEVCKRAFAQGEVITVGNDGATLCYTDGDGGCGLQYIFKTGKMLAGNPMVFKPKKDFIENEAGELVRPRRFGLVGLLRMMGLR